MALFRGLSGCAPEGVVLGFSFLGIPVHASSRICLTPQLWVLRGLSQSPGSSYLHMLAEAGSVRQCADELLLPATDRGGALFTQPAKLQEREQRVNALPPVATCFAATDEL